MYELLTALNGKSVTVNLKCGNEYTGTVRMVSNHIFRLERYQSGKLMRRSLLVDAVAGVLHNPDDL